MAKQDSQKEAEKKNEIADEVQMTPPVSADDQYFKDNEAVQGKLKDFGETDLEHFTNKILSDSVFAKQAVRKLLGLDGDKPFVVAQAAGSPQEHNITGTLDHATFPPKVKNAATGLVDSLEKPASVTEGTTAA